MKRTSEKSQKTEVHKTPDLKTTVFTQVNQNRESLKNCPRKGTFKEAGQTSCDFGMGSWNSGSTLVEKPENLNKIRVFVNNNVSSLVH